ncbi:MAG: UPF0070 protein YfgM [Burkholderiaceae bacterium]|jgi:predicted negative regulator of RcsB-dependent stress response|nr:MAG: UPF0070 protein YfgM [Burkholderiaceae bacterium]
MATALDLEEQEQLDQLKHFWRKWGNAITWVLIVVFGAVAAWNGYQYWQRREAARAAILFDTVRQAAQAGDLAMVTRSFSDIRNDYGSTTYAQQAGFLAAKVFYDKGKPDEARQALAWVADKTSDEGYRAIARLRLASLLMQAKSYDDARKQLDGSFPDAFAPLVADRLGDIALLQGKKTEAVAEYLRAYHGLTADRPYRRIVEVKLASLGADPQAQAAAAASGAASAASAGGRS